MKVTFTLDQAARVRFTVQQPQHAGRGKRGKRFVTLKLGSGSQPSLFPADLGDSRGW